MRKLLLAATAAAAIAAPAAAVTTYKFSVTNGGGYAIWTLPASPTPDTIGAASFVLDNIIIDGFSTTLEFYAGASGGGFDFQSSSSNFSTYGDVLFTGTLSAPTFTLGSYSLGSFDGFTYDLTISAVPEPASWAMLIAGFGLTGAALRRRRTSALTA